mmetsp:Transcript_13620/g.32240  ORF Transcript_13620/g.32240 Transcript_13620/m.32240 type:complete len:192 (-) Transcript_13620:1305-1880(-)
MSRRVFVGNLPQDIRERELEDLFYKFGRILEIDLKLPPRPPGFAFIEFEDPRDASAAVQGRDGYDFYGTRLRVELARGGSGRSTYGGGRRADRGYSAAPPPNAEFRVNVFGLPPTASWQDLKDHMRKAGDVSFAQSAAAKSCGWNSMARLGCVPPVIAVRFPAAVLWREKRVNEGSGPLVPPEAAHTSSRS